MAWLSKLSLSRPLVQWLACLACLSILQLVSSADVFVKNECTENVSVGVAFVTDNTNKCDFLDEGADPPMCVNYWIGASGGELAKVVGGLSNTCIYLTAYMNDDITYTWGASNCSGCTFDLEHKSCTAGEAGCYEWTKVGASEQVRPYLQSISFKGHLVRVTNTKGKGLVHSQAHLLPPAHLLLPPSHHNVSLCFFSPNIQ